MKKTNKKAEIMDLLTAKNRLSYRKIANIVGCHFRYVHDVAKYLSMTKTRPIMDFRGLLKGDTSK